MTQENVRFVIRKPAFAVLITNDPGHPIHSYGLFGSSIVTYMHFVGFWHSGSSCSDVQPNQDYLTCICLCGKIGCPCRISKVYIVVWWLTCNQPAAGFLNLFHGKNFYLFFFLSSLYIYIFFFSPLCIFISYIFFLYQLNLSFILFHFIFFFTSLLGDNNNILFQNEQILRK